LKEKLGTARVEGGERNAGTSIQIGYIVTTHFPGVSSDFGMETNLVQDGQNDWDYDDEDIHA
jgi:hypothetical protein